MSTYDEPCTHGAKVGRDVGKTLITSVVHPGEKWCLWGKWGRTGSTEVGRTGLGDLVAGGSRIDFL